VTNNVDVVASGAVLLGDSVVCDGFQSNRAIRVQTHVHDDHMSDFESSKGFQDLYMSQATHKLLISEFNSDLEIRQNITTVAHGAPIECAEGRITLLSSGHMLGAVQVCLERPDGVRLGYSGDFHWPLTDVIKVDELVVDSTYGNENSVRAYTQEEAEIRLLQLVIRLLRKESVHIKAHRGTVQRALQILSGNVNVPLLASERLCKEVGVYQEFGCAVCDIVPTTSVKAEDTLKDGRYVRFYSKGDRSPVDSTGGSTIVLSAFMNKTEDPVIEYSEKSYSVALSNHADFEGTIAYIAETGAKRIITDNTRGSGVELALGIQRRLGIEAKPSSNSDSREWGLG
jgi:putative mRNA 3-end processing factor